jgi:flagellin
MANSINTNIGALTAQKNMLKINNELSDAMTRLSSGLRINSAADDAAGAAISSKMESQVRSLSVAIRNSYDAISMTQTAEGALNETENMLQRVRELAVQAGNSTLSDSDRVMIQSEVTALISEIDSISKNTHFNDVKLLDGSNKTVNFQIGINAADTLAVSLQKSDSISLGLSGSQGVKLLTSERVPTTDFSAAHHSLAASDIKINGKDAFSTTFASDLTATGANEAQLIATAINLNTGIHGAEADAFNSLTSAVKGTFNMDNTFTINGDTVELATSYESLVSNINQAVSGINATLNSNNTVTLSNTTGSSIVIASSGSSDVGFTNGTYTGFLSLKNVDGSKVTIEASNEVNGYTDGLGTIADVNSIGFNEQSVAGSVETATVSGTSLSANEIKINDVLIGESSSGSASSIANAINSKSSETGVTANAKNEVQVAFNTAVMPGSANEFYVNGTEVNLTSASGLHGIVSQINAANIGDVIASAISDGSIKLTSETGQNIKVQHFGDTDFIRAYKDINGTVNTAGVVGGSATAAESLFAAADITTPGDITLLSPANFNSRVSIQGVAHDGADVVVDPNSFAVAAAVGATTATLLAAASNSHAHGVQIRITETNVGDGSDVTVTVNGTDMDGNSITESFLGATKNGSVDGTKTFQTVTSVTYSKTDTATFEIGALHGNANETYTLTGVDVFGNTVSETMRGEGGAIKALSENVYASITKISTTTTAGSNVSIGNYNGEAQTGLGALDADGLYAEAQVASGANTPLAANASKDLGGVLITMTEGNNDTAANAVLTVTGTDMFDNVITEAITGPTKNGTVTGTKIFKTVTALSNSAASTSTKVQIGFKQAADDFTVRGNLTMSNSTGETIKIESVAENNDETMAVANDGTFGTSETILQKLGVQSQSAQQEVSGTNLSVGTLASANASLEVIDKAIESISLFRSSFGAVENRIDASISNLTTLKVNTQAAQSRIEDADFAAETSNLTKSQILSQAATSMLAQANASKQNLLALLQG